jgi:hypothetical protein
MKPRFDHVSDVVVDTRPRSCRSDILLRTGQNKIEGEGIRWFVSGSQLQRVLDCFPDVQLATQAP